MTIKWPVVPKTSEKHQVWRVLHYRQLFFLSARVMQELTKQVIQ